MTSLGQLGLTRGFEEAQLRVFRVKNVDRVVVCGSGLLEAVRDHSQLAKIRVINVDGRSQALVDSVLVAGRVAREGLRDHALVVRVDHDDRRRSALVPAVFDHVVQVGFSQRNSRTRGQGIVRMARSRTGQRGSSAARTQHNVRAEPSRQTSSRTGSTRRASVSSDVLKEHGFHVTLHFFQLQSDLGCKALHVLGGCVNSFRGVRHRHDLVADLGVVAETLAKGAVVFSRRVIAFDDAVRGRGGRQFDNGPFVVGGSGFRASTDSSLERGLLGGDHRVLLFEVVTNDSVVIRFNGLCINGHESSPFRFAHKHRGGDVFDPASLARGFQSGLLLPRCCGC